MVLLGVLVWVNHQLIIDTISFWRYKPSSEIAAIVNRTQLSDDGKFMFYASHPRIDDSKAFNEECERKESGTAILGCYVNDRIFIYDVTDSRLEGIKEVTAAHEMLHAVYDRLSGDEKNRINKLVDAEYEKLKDNPSYAERMAFYDRTEPGERGNELHSILGTEVSTLHSDLEAHYGKYFKDRKKILSLYNNYNSAFTSLAKQAKQLSSELDSINAQIKSASASYNEEVKTLNEDINAFNSRAASGSFDSQAQFNNERQALVDRANQISKSREAVNALIDRYNMLRTKYNSIVTQSNDLYKSIDSSLAPAPKV